MTTSTNIHATKTLATLSRFVSQNAKQVTLAAWGLLIAIPAIIYLSSSQLFPSIRLNSLLAEALYWLTSTGTAPYGIITGVLILVVCYRLLNRQQFAKLVLAVSISMAATLSLNQFLKPYFAEPRPNAILLEQSYLLNTKDFYQKDKLEKRQILGVAVNQLEIARPDLLLSDAIKGHWQHEVGYAFPSGHTLFAVTLALVVCFYLLLSGLIAMPLLLVSWAISMGLSRMLLGMHWPQDVLASTFIGGCIAAASIFLAQCLWPRLWQLISPQRKVQQSNRR
ncbi:phosphatase PAP2 family protein [Shewanella sairae]|uniref:undecaprenyl-diphosphate phosphatase n=1 Tax=Shewanella sairae TaxID=190310 RepID=A0ABQ4PIH4_9GAMM|nr:phosphatase PAP2 family protein [Shewanella sairae]MCL1131566.1 phosphatase PAP2 family protein [Shewanella sairae]GIU47177.1 phosphatase PAP2 family protein [Shewanella sairae]